MLPSTTAALRFNPRSFARLIGEFLNAHENCCCVVARISRERARVLPRARRARRVGRVVGQRRRELDLERTYRLGGVAV
jgi:hypothetical protein